VNKLNGNEDENVEVSNKTMGGILLGILAFIILIVLLLAIRTVKPGTVKVVTRWGRVTGRTLGPGIHLVIPLADRTLAYDTKKVIYETTTKEKQKGSDADYKDYPVDTNTQDGQQVDIFYTVRFSIHSGKAGWVAQEIGSQEALVEKIVKTESRIWARNVPRRFTAEDLYTGTGSQEVQNEIYNELYGTFADNGITLDGVGIREIKFTDDYIHAIERKQIQAVKIETEENIAEQAKFQKEARITTAEGLAKEQELQRATLSDQVLEKLFLDKWDGVLPRVITGDSGLLLSIPGL